MGNAVDLLYHRRVEARQKQAEKERKVFQACLVWAHNQEERLKREAVERRERRRHERENERMERDRIIMEMCLKNIDKEKRSTKKLLKQREDNRDKRMREMMDLSERRMRGKEEHIKRESEITRKNIEHIENIYLKSRENTKTRIHLMAKKKEEEKKDFIRRATTAEKTHRDDMEKSKKRVKSLEKKIVTERILWQQKLLTARHINGEKKKTSQELWTIGREIVEKRKLLFEKTHDEEGNKLCVPQHTFEIDWKQNDSLKQNPRTPKDNQNEQNAINTNLSTVFEENNPVLEIDKVKMTPRQKIPPSQKHKNNSTKVNRKVNIQLQRFYMPQKKIVSLQDHHLKFESETGVPKRQNATNMLIRGSSTNNQTVTGSEVSETPGKDPANGIFEGSNQESNRRSDTVQRRDRTAEQGKNKTSKLYDQKNRNVNKRSITNNLANESNLDIRQVVQNRELLKQQRKMAETSPKPDENLSIVKYSHGNKVKETNVNESENSDTLTARKKPTPNGSEQKLSESKPIRIRARQELKGVGIRSEETVSKPKERQTQNLISALKKSTKSEEDLTRKGQVKNGTELKSINVEREQNEQAQKPNVVFGKSKELYRKPVVTIIDPLPKGQTMKQEKGQVQPLASTTNMNSNQPDRSSTKNIVKTDKSGEVATEVSSHPTAPSDPNTDRNHVSSKQTKPSTRTLSGSHYGNFAFNFPVINGVHSTKNSQGEVASTEMTHEKHRSNKVTSNKKQLGSDKNSKFDEKDPRNGATTNVNSKKAMHSSVPMKEDDSEPSNTKRSVFPNKPSVVQRIEEVGKQKAENTQDTTSAKAKDSLFESEEDNDTKHEKDSRKIKSIPFKPRHDIALRGQVGLFVLDQRISEVQRRIDKMTKSSTEIPVA